MASRRLVLAAGAAALIWPGLAQAQDRPRGVGLVIGNDAYGGRLARLNNAVKDARGVAAALNGCNILVPDSAVIANATRERMLSATKEFASRLKAAPEDQIGFFYYSGHGASRADAAGSNYLIASGDFPQLDERVWNKSVALHEVLDTLRNVGRPFVLAFDACRTVLNLPAIQTATSSADLSRYGAGEFQRDIGGQATLFPAQTAAYLVEQPKWQNGSGTFAKLRGFGVMAGATNDHFLAFSSWEGQFALDGGETDEMGPYATALTVAMRAGKRTVMDMFDDVRLSVLDRTVQQQEPMGLVRLSRTARDVVIAPPGLREPEAKTNKSLRQALVVSCSYADQADVQAQENLETTKGDADLVEEALVQNGFNVRRQDNPNKPEFNGLLLEMISSLRATGRSAVGVVYFAGIGSSYQDRNYLLPMPGQGERLPQVPEELEPMAMSVQGIITSLELADGAGIIVLVDGGRRTNWNSGKVQEGGFAKEFGTKRVMLVHATLPGQATLLREHNGRLGSPFAQALNEELLDKTQPRRDVSAVMSSVMDKVRLATAGRMTPYGLSSMDATSSLGSNPPTARAPIYFRSQADLDTSP